MKRFYLVILSTAMAAMPVLASPHLINLGYNMQIAGASDFSRRSIGVVYTSIIGQTSGFYAQVAPFIAMSDKSDGWVYRYSDMERFGGGLTFTFGFGSDINFGTMGLIVGGGFFGTMYAHHNSYYDYIFYNAATGVGGGAHFYFQPGSGSFVINAGLDAAWRPFELYGYSDTGFEEFLFEGQDFNINLNAGIGFRY